MRQIKFRAWDVRKGKMVTDFVIAPTSPTWGCFPIEQPCDEVRNALRIFQDQLGDYTLVDWSNFYALEEDNFILMQFTGLLDKAGKEIWEGDIVRFTRKQGYWSHNRGDVESVKYIDDHQAQFCGFGFSPLLPLTRAKAKKVEVIGNIYENKDLLN